jgi:glyoxylase-like metal-dependent hydrolase (beta-lactamase superfamily II)
MQFLTEPEPPRSVPLPVLPGISRIVAPNPGPMTYWGTNTYILDLPEGPFIVDPGPDEPTHVASLLAATAGRLAGILVTHTHHDHIGALPALRAATSAPVYAWHAPGDPAATPDIPLHNGDRIGPWEAVFTPGHAPDHLCFTGPGGVTISGDHVMGWSTTVVIPPAGSMADYFASLHLLLGRPAAMYLPGHGPALAPPLPYVTALLHHREQREAAIRAALEAKPRPVRELAQRIYPGLADNLRPAAERNLAAHLAKLAAEGHAADTEHGWVKR